MLAVHPCKQALTSVGKQTTKGLFGYLRIWLLCHIAALLRWSCLSCRNTNPHLRLLHCNKAYLQMFAPTNTTATISKPYYLLPGACIFIFLPHKDTYHFCERCCCSEGLWTCRWDLLVISELKIYFHAKC